MPDFLASHFSMRVIYCYPISLHKSSHCRISSHRMELVRDIIFKCLIGKADHRQLNVFTLVLLMLDCRYLTIFCQRCWHVIFSVKCTDNLFLVSWSFKTPFALTLVLLMQEPLPSDEPEVYIQNVWLAAIFPSLYGYSFPVNSPSNASFNIFMLFRLEVTFI